VPEFLPPALDVPIRLTSPQDLAPRYALPGDAGADLSSAEDVELAPFERALAAGAEYRSLDELLAEADVVSVHLRLVPETRGLLTREKLARLKPSALFVNTARAAIVDEPALVEMLRDGRLWGAALDVFAEEPLPPGHPLIGLPNVVLTPHVGWVSEGSYAQFFAGIVDNVLAYLDGRPIPRLLNPAALARQAARG
jgi:phosphoglycerate dehydrogenase-like enzyme